MHAEHHAAMKPAPTPGTIMPMRRHNNMPRWQRTMLYLTVILLTASGVLWSCVHWLAWPETSRAAMDGLPSPWEPWLMKLHGVGVVLVLLLTGRISGVHLVKGWRMRWRRGEGVALLAVLGGLTLGGYALLYLVPDNWRDTLGLVHSAMGALMVALLWWHRRAAVPTHRSR
jgi:hypothetical protein